MCGIAGVLDMTSSRDQLERNALAMADRLAHRGPDDHGLWGDPEAGVMLTHRRLSIVDLSPAGHQPMSSVERPFHHPLQWRNPIAAICVANSRRVGSHFMNTRDSRLSCECRTWAGSGSESRISRDVSCSTRPNMGL